MIKFKSLERFNDFTYVGEAVKFGENVKISVALPLAPDNWEKKVELSVRDEKLYARLKDNPDIEVRIPEEFLSCEKREDTLVCNISPVIYNVLAIAKANTERPILVNKVEYDSKYDIYRVETASGDEYFIRPQELICCDKWKIRYINLFKENHQLKAVIAVEDMQNKNWIKMYKMNIPKSLLSLHKTSDSGIKYYGQILPPTLF